MSSNLMKTEVGGEQTQYESVNTFQKPHAKSGGQLGKPETTTDPSSTIEAKQHMSDRGESTAENIRYGQNISENGVGGMTTNQSGQASDDFARNDQSDNGAQQRRAQGYGGDMDMDRDIGA